MLIGVVGDGALSPRNELVISKTVAQTSDELFIAART
jgi:hypothetical protein